MQDAGYSTGTFSPSPKVALVFSSVPVLHIAAQGSTVRRERGGERAGGEQCKYVYSVEMIHHQYNYIDDFPA